jgi:hypothetical protein
VLNSVDDNFALACLKPKELIPIIVGFHAYFFHGFEVHKNKLAVLAGV